MQSKPGCLLLALAQIVSPEAGVYECHLPQGNLFLSPSEDVQLIPVHSLINSLGGTLSPHEHPVPYQSS